MQLAPTSPDSLAVRARPQAPCRSGPDKPSHNHRPCNLAERYGDAQVTSRGNERAFQGETSRIEPIILLLVPPLSDILALIYRSLYTND